VVVPTTRELTLERALSRVRDSFVVVARAGDYELLDAEPWPTPADLGEAGRRVALLAACHPESLGDASFCADHQVRYPCMSGAMANGIGSVEIVEAMGRAGMLGIFGAAGLPIAKTEAAIDRLSRALNDTTPYGFNLIHSPQRTRERGRRHRPVPPPWRTPGRGVGVS